MNANEEVVQKHVVVNSPGQRSEVLTERTQSAPRKSGPSTGTIAIIAILAITVVGAILYIVTNRNANESANRNANLEVASQTAPPAAVQQPAPIQQAAPVQQAPVIIEQPAPAQLAPVVIQQPADTSQRVETSANADAKMQDIATKRLTDDPDMALVIMTVTDARAVLNGTVNSAVIKAKAEQTVKSVRGIKSIDNKLVVTG